MQTKNRIDELIKEAWAEALVPEAHDALDLDRTAKLKEALVKQGKKDGGPTDWELDNLKPIGHAALVNDARLRAGKTKIDHEIEVTEDRDGD